MKSRYEIHINSVPNVLNMNEKEKLYKRDCFCYRFSVLNQNMFIVEMISGVFSLYKHCYAIFVNVNQMIIIYYRNYFSGKRTKQILYNITSFRVDTKVNQLRFLKSFMLPSYYIKINVVIHEIVVNIRRTEAYWIKLHQNI